MGEGERSSSLFNILHKSFRKRARIVFAPYMRVIVRLRKFYSNLNDASRLQRNCFRAKYLYSATDDSDSIAVIVIIQMWSPHRLVSITYVYCVLQFLLYF